MNIRLAQPSDISELAMLYRQTVLVHAPQHYTPAQTAMWASFGAETDTFRQFILSVTTYVAEEAGEIVGFAGISNDGHVASTYVRHDCQRQGIGMLLMQVVLEHAQRQGILRLFAEASEFSLGLFRRVGFRVYDTEWVDRDGVEFRRYLVERQVLL